jgi:hypothetical protein
MLQKITFGGIPLLITLSFAQAPDSLPQMPGWPKDLAQSHATGVTLADVNKDGYLEILMGTIEACEFHVWDYQGNELPGWPKSVGIDSIWSKCAIGDIDPSYPGLEIIVANYRSRIFAWHADGTDVPGWPHYLCQTGLCKSPSLFDIDLDGDLEIIYSSNTGVFVLNHDCTNYPGWPVYNSSIGTPSVADVDNDGIIEICIQTYDAIYLYDKDANVESGWPITIQNGHSGYIQPTLADLDGDGDLEILHAYSNGTEHQNYVGIYHHDGTNFENWPLPFPGAQTYTTPAVGDLDGDGDLEILGGGRLFSPEKALMARHHTGDTVAGWPVIVSGLECSAIIFDLDLDDNGKREVIINDNSYHLLHAFNDNGTPVPDWPQTTGNSFPNCAAVGDVDADGDIEVAFVAGGYVNLFTVEGVEYCPYMTEWSCWYHDNWHTGWFHPLAPQNPIATSTPDWIRLIWNANTEPDIAGYNVYRSATSGGPYEKLTDTLITQTGYNDVPADSNEYYYCVSAEIQAQTESRLSNEVSGHLGIKEYQVINKKNSSIWPSIFTGPLLLSDDINCNIFDITGRTVVPEEIKPGIYFVEIDGVITQKVVKIR